MLKKIIGTVFTRGGMAILSFAMVMINARAFGAEGVGTISLITLSISINILLSGLIGTGSLVYFVSRKNKALIYLYSLGWDLIACVAGSFLLQAIHLIPEGFANDVLLLSILLSIISSNQMMLMGHEEIKRYNFLTFFQTFILFLVLVSLIYIFRIFDIHAYVYALYASYLLCFFWSFCWIRKYVKNLSFADAGKTFKELFVFGFYGQLANVFQLLNYRFSYYLIDRFLGRNALGVFDVGTKLSEGMWIVGKSVAAVEYTSIANTERQQADQLALKFMKVTFVATLALLAILLILPESIYLWIFGNDFAGIKMVMYAMSLGVLSLACSMMLSQYFSGIGKVHINSISSGIGLIVMVGLGILLIPQFSEQSMLNGLIAAGLITSCTYTVSFLVQAAIFKKLTGFKMRDYMPTKSDYKFTINILRKTLQK